MSFSRSSDLIRAYRRGSKKQIFSKEIPGSRTIYGNLHSQSKYHRKKKLLEIFAAFGLSVLLLIGAPAYNIHLFMSTQDQHHFRPLAKNQVMISSPLPFYDQLVDSFFRALFSTISYYSNSNIVDELRSYVPNYSEFLTPELGTLSQSETGKEFLFSKAEATVDPVVLLNLFKFFTGTVIAFLYMKRLLRPVRLHDCNFKVNQLQKFTLSEKCGNTMVNLSFFTSFRPYSVGNIFKRWSEIKYDLSTKILKGDSIMKAQSFDVKMRQLPPLYPKSKEGYFLGNSPFGIETFLLGQKDVSMAEIPIEDLVFTKNDRNFEKLLTAVSEVKTDIEGDISFTQQLHLNSLRNFYIKQLLENGFGDLFEDLSDIKQNIYSFKVEKDTFDEKYGEVILAQSSSAQIVSIPRVNLWEFTTFDTQQGYLEAFVKVCKL